jgi:NDP-sugar pyrophosphorylase family protein
MIETGVILAGGLATRLRPITEKIPKALVEVAGRPFIEHQLALLQRNGLRHIILCIGFLGEQIEAALGDGSRYGLKLEYSYDGPTQLGTGGALAKAGPLLAGAESFWVLYGDSYLNFDYRAVATAFETQPDKLGLMTVFHNGNKWDTSNVIFKDGKLLKYDKHNRTPEMEYIDYGAAILQQVALERLPTDRAVDLNELYSGMVEAGLMTGYEVTQRFYEIGSHAGLEETERYLTEKTQAEGY